MKTQTIFVFFSSSKIRLNLRQNYLVNLGKLIHVFLILILTFLTLEKKTQDIWYYD
jgi:hypothetical protein